MYASSYYFWPTPNEGDPGLQLQRRSLPLKGPINQLRGNPLGGTGIKNKIACGMADIF